MDNTDVVSIVLRDDIVTKKLHSSPEEVKQAIAALNWGKASDTKDFLNMQKTTGTTINRKTSERKRASHIFLHVLPQNMQAKIKQGSTYTHLVCNLLTNLFCPIVTTAQPSVCMAKDHMPVDKEYIDATAKEIAFGIEICIAVYYNCEVLY